MKASPITGGPDEWIIDRRYIRTDGQAGIMGAFEIGQRWWMPITGLHADRCQGRPNLRLLDRRRGGKLIWKRK